MSLTTSDLLPLAATQIFTKKEIYYYNIRYLQNRILHNNCTTKNMLPSQNYKPNILAITIVCP